MPALDCQRTRRRGPVERCGRRCCSNAVAIAVRCRAWSFSIVGCVSISLLVVGRAPQVLVRQRGSCRRGLVEREPILLVGENVLDGAIAVGAQSLSTRTGRVEPVQSVDAAEAHKAETRAIALLGMRAPLKNADDEPPGGKAAWSAHAMRREGVHSACARCARGMWATSVAYRPRPVRRACDATSRPVKKTSTVVAVMRASTRACTS